LKQLSERIRRLSASGTFNMCNPRGRQTDPESRHPSSSTTQPGAYTVVSQRMTLSDVGREALRLAVVVDELSDPSIMCLAESL
jgi:hypothetical protein